MNAIVSAGLALLPRKFDTADYAKMIEAIGQYISGWSNGTGPSITDAGLTTGRGDFRFSSKDVKNTLVRGGELGYWARAVADSILHDGAAPSPNPKPNYNDVWAELKTSRELGVVLCAMRVAHALPLGQELRDEAHGLAVFKRAFSIGGATVEIDPARWHDAWTDGGITTMDAGGGGGPQQPN